jgi:enoyl-CoA hydratase/carnithine racemase
MTTVETVNDGARLTLVLDWAEGKNALNRSAVASLREAIASVRQATEQPRVVVIRSAVPGFFSIGMDLSRLAVSAAARRPTADYDGIRSYVSLLAELATLPAVTIAAVKGMAVGGGVDLAAACDIVVAGEDAVFSIAQLRNGVFPLTTSAVLVPKIGHNAFMFWALSGLNYPARKAEKLGLVSHVVATEEVDATVDRLAGRIADFNAPALRLGLDAMRFGTTADVLGRLQQAGALLGLNYQFLQEGMPG